MAKKRRTDQNNETTQNPAWLEAFVARLNAMHEDIDVIEAIAHGHGSISMKIQTPIATYLSTASEEDWIAAVEADIKAAKSFLCPFCKCAHNWSVERSNCHCKCGAVFASSAETLVRELAINSMTPSEALDALLNKTVKTILDRQHSGTWGRRMKTPAPTWLDQVTGPDDKEGASDIPLLADTEQQYETTPLMAVNDVNEILSLVGEDSEEVIHLPTCRFCIHAIEIDDRQDRIFTQTVHFCVYPLGKSDVETPNGIGLSLDVERDRNYEEIPEAIFQNALTGCVLDGLTEVDDIDDGLEAQADAPINKFFGPICRRFEIDRDHYELKGCPYEILPATAPVRFGLVDLDRKRAERDDMLKHEHLEALWNATRAALDALQGSPNGKILKTRIEKKNLHSAETKTLLSLIEAHTTEEARATGDLVERFSYLFNISNSSRPKIDEMLKARAGASKK